ncbi:MAG TPA: beta-phosphoglucomutase [Bacillota bacterium]
MKERGFSQAVIFDLDGVIVSTDEFHYWAWKRLTEREGIYFDRRINEKLRGIDRMQSLEIILEKASREYGVADKQRLAEEKNEYYIELINSQLNPSHILPGVMILLPCLKRKQIGIAIGSSSKNALLILEKIGLNGYFDVVVDGNEIEKSKPDPEVFLLAAEKLGVPAENCLVVEDAASGVEAALSAGMSVLGVGSAYHHPKATHTVPDLSKISVQELIALIGPAKTV